MFKNIKRLREVSHILTKYGFSHLIDTLKLPKITFKKKVDSKKLTRGEKIRFIFEELGATYIKFGQVLSIRPDIFPSDVIIELEKLQDRVPPFSFEELEIESNEIFNTSIFKVFKEFDKKPLASGSIGQVHLAKLNSGEKVVVKVRRPNIEKQINEDIELLFFMASLFEKYMPDSKLYNPIKLVEEFKKSIFKEINYQIEANNLKKINQLFIDDENICIPKVYWEYTNTNFLCMEYIDGIKVTDFEKLDKLGFDRELIAKRGANAIFKQIFEYGFFHADPHAGNMFILEQNKVGFIDLGMVGSLLDDEKHFLANLLIAINKGNINKIINIFLDKDLISEDCNIQEFKNDMNEMFQKYFNIPLKQINMGKALNEFIGIIYKYKINLPANLILVIRSLTMIEGIGRQLYSNFNPIKDIEPFVESLIKEQYNPKNIGQDGLEFFKDSLGLLKILPRDLRLILREIKKGKISINFEHKGLEKLNNTINIASERFSFSIIMASIIIASSLIIQSNTPPYLWGWPILGVIGFILSAIIGFTLLFSIIRKK